MNFYTHTFNTYIRKFKHAFALARIFTYTCKGLLYVSVKVFFGINSFSLYTPLFLFSFNVFNALFILNVFFSFLMNFLQLMSFCQLSGKGNTLLYILLFVLLLFVFYLNKRKCVFVTNLQFFVNWLVFIRVQLYIERIFN